MTRNSHKKQSDPWLGVFCPDGRCHAEPPTQVV